MNSSRMLRKVNAVVVLMTTSNSPFSTAAMFVATGAWRRVYKEIYRMKKALICALLTVALCCFGTALFAQMQGGSGMGGGAARGPMSTDERLQHLTQMLNLTSDQQAKIKPILENEAQQMQALRQDTLTSRDEKMPKMREIRQNTNSQIATVLTPDQQKKWEQMQSRHMQPPPNATGAAPGGEQGTPPSAPPQQ